MKFFDLFSCFRKKKYYNVTSSNISTKEINEDLTYCTICDLLHINGQIIRHCYKCNKCHKSINEYCNICKNCYDIYSNKDILKHRQNCNWTYLN
jgi:hypothetical protein